MSTYNKVIFYYIFTDVFYSSQNSAKTITRLHLTSTNEMCGGPTVPKCNRQVGRHSESLIAVHVQISDILSCQNADDILMHYVWLLPTGVLIHLQEKVIIVGILSDPKFVNLGGKQRQSVSNLPL